jgi:hypothetical protein
LPRSLSLQALVHFARTNVEGLGVGLKLMTDFVVRRAKRQPLVAVVDFWWLNPNGTVEGSHGVTHDVSSSGVLIEASECPPIGSHIQLTILIKRMSNSQGLLELHGEGTVVRIARKSSAFAASVQFYSERPNQ